MKGTIVNYRRGRRTLHPHQMILEFPEEKNPGSLVGKKVVWTSPAGKEIHGKILGLHGRKGAVRASFTKGLPGQSIGETVALIESAPKPKKAVPKKA